ncbi:hypothetical protein GN958_ATG00091 [Phytophthora infestans]|uniref:Uncharacterized protein n=1 Tax=Phytophthora infestans TaxID=4787 RepID=A0A8S9VJ52_PHYIN|nr:hypothetical protein GN958_ATG00091 [Phytophthora infestans]
MEELMSTMKEVEDLAVAVDVMEKEGAASIQPPTDEEKNETAPKRGKYAKDVKYEKVGAMEDEEDEAY